MNNPQYYRLTGKGLKRVITEYLPEGANKWQLEPIECNDEDIYKWNPPPNVKKFPRAEEWDHISEDLEIVEKLGDIHTEQEKE